MGVGGIWQWVVVLVIILLLFGTKRLRNMGSDLGQAVRGFRKGMQSEPEKIGDEEQDPLTTESRTHSETEGGGAASGNK